MPEQPVANAGENHTSESKWCDDIGQGIFESSGQQQLEYEADGIVAAHHRLEKIAP